MSTPEQYQRPPLRSRRFGGGYRREDVDFALAELRVTLSRLEHDLESLRDRNRELDGELRVARHEIESFRAKEHELWRTMSASLRRAAEIEEGAESRAREIIAEAEEEASRIRSDAGRRVEASSMQLNELQRLKGNLFKALRRVVGDFDRAISRAERGEELFPDATQTVSGGTAEPPQAPPQAAAEVSGTAPSPPEPVQPAAASPPFVAPLEQRPPSPLRPPASPPPQASVEVSRAAPPPSSPSPPAPPAAPEREEPVFETRVELDAGPFADFAALSAFERSLVHLAKVEDVYVRRLADDRALIELTLSEPSSLLQTMRESLPYTLEVRSATRSRLVVDVSVQTPAGAR
jgi:DivIVA protein